MHLEHAGLLLERDGLQPPGVGADREHLLAREVGRALAAQPRLAGEEALVVLAHQRQPAGVEQHHVAGADLDALALGLLVDLLAVEGRALGHDVLAEVGRHVEHDAARHERRDLLDAELAQAVDLHELAVLEAVVVDVVDADMAQPVDLAAHAHPAGVDVVVVAGLGRPEGRTAGLARRRDRERPATRRIGGRLGVGLGAEPVGLAGLHQLRGVERELRTEQVGGADLVGRAVLRLAPLFGVGEGLARAGGQAEGEGQCDRSAPQRLVLNHGVSLRGVAALEGRRPDARGR